GEVVGGRHELASRHTVLVNPDHAHCAERVLLDQLRCAVGRLLLRPVVQAMLGDEAVLADAALATHALSLTRWCRGPRPSRWGPAGVLCSPGRPAETPSRRRSAPTWSPCHRQRR